MLHIEEDYEIPIELNYYQNHEHFINSAEQNTTQNMTDYAKQELKRRSSMN